MRQSFFLRRAYILEAGQQWLTTPEQRTPFCKTAFTPTKMAFLALLVDVNRPTILFFRRAYHNPIGGKHIRIEEKGVFPLNRDVRPFK